MFVGFYDNAVSLLLLFFQTSAMSMVLPTNHTEQSLSPAHKSLLRSASDSLSSKSATALELKSTSAAAAATPIEEEKKDPDEIVRKVVRE